MTCVPEPYYLPTADPDVFVATPSTAGPWDPRAQHGGPPSALVTRAIERLPSSIAGPSQLARLTVEILGPIGIGEMRVRAEVVRPGRAVELIEAELAVDGRAALRARAWRIRTTELALPLPELAEPPQLKVAPPIPEQPAAFRNSRWERGYLGTVDFRFVAGHVERPGPADAWTRLRVPVVAGEEPSPTQRLVAVADSGSGLSSVLDFEHWLFINTDLSLHLHRLPEGEWIYMSTKSTLDSLGIGLAETELFDTRGRVGRGAQALLVGPRPT
jgi:hypothetical protein